jgi:hypothetical protein
MNPIIQRVRATILSLNTVVPVRQLATKFRKTKEKRYIVQAQRARNDELEKKASVSGLDWRIVSSWYKNYFETFRCTFIFVYFYYYLCVSLFHFTYSVLHRYPVVVPDVLDWQADFWEVQEKIADKQREVRLEDLPRHLSIYLCI